MKRATVHKGKKLPGSKRSQGRFLGLVRSWPLLLCLGAACATSGKPPESQESTKASATGNPDQATLDAAMKAATEKTQTHKGGAVGAAAAADATFIQNYVQWLAAMHPDENWVGIHTQHIADGSFMQFHIEEKLPDGTRGYDIFHQKKGILFRVRNQGDGGADNWAYVGEFALDPGTNMVVAAPH